MAKVSLTHIPYRGGGPAIVDALQVPETMKRLRDGMTEPVGKGPKEFAEFITQVAFTR